MEEVVEATMEIMTVAEGGDNGCEGGAIKTM